ncbi:MAG: YqeG family HAD IIIA-type phosphatase [Oscillospiraceae bacterium]|nr:YqeG family HAD IIIA-type phosphatase [Oscillospiraceae bacterium]
MFKPTIWVKNVLQIDKKLLYKMGVKGLILDLDNTLSMHGSPAAEQGVTEWLQSMRDLNVKMMIVSNNKHRRVAPLAAELGLEFVSFGCKPMPFGVSKAAKIMRAWGVRKSQLAIVGDQIFTDIMGGNLYGIKSILVEPFYMEKHWVLKTKRKVEGALFKRDYSNLTVSDEDTGAF